MAPTIAISSAVPNSEHEKPPIDCVMMTWTIIMGTVEISVGFAVGKFVFELVGEKVGEVGREVGGEAVGEELSAGVGNELGSGVGNELGSGVGNELGSGVGSELGLCDSVGCGVGWSYAVWLSVLTQK